MAVISVVGMEQPRLSIAVVVAIMIPFNCLATYYTVGNNLGWKPGVNYTAWASGKQFVVGDYLVFNYTAGRHNTMVVHKMAYVSCDSRNALETYTSGNDTIMLSSTGHKYYLCGYPSHCANGMRLAITVGKTSTSSAPSPSPTTSSSTPSTTAPSPSPTTSSSPPSTTAPSPSPATSSSPPSTTATSYRLDGVVLGAALVFAMVLL